MRTRIAALPGLAPSVVSIEPNVRTFPVTVPNGSSRQRKTVTRRQLPVTPAYAFTEYRSQGQTIPYVIVDLARPPGQKLTLFNIMWPCRTALDEIQFRSCVL